MKYLIEYHDQKWMIFVTGNTCRVMSRNSLRSIVVDQMTRLTFPHLVVCFDFEQQQMSVWCDTKTDIREVPEPDEATVVMIPFFYRNIQQMANFVRQLIVRLDSGCRITRATTADGWIHLSSAQQFYLMSKKQVEKRGFWQWLGWS